MIKKAMVLLMGIMLMVSIAAADETSRTIQSMTAHRLSIMIILAEKTRR